MGIDPALHLIHSMETRQDFSQLDHKSAENFHNACLVQGVKKKSYISADWVSANPPRRTLPAG